MLPVAVAVSVVAWPTVVGLLLDSAALVIGVSFTVIATLSAAVEASPRLSVTNRSKVSVAGVPGAVKVGCCADALLRVTAGPPVCCQA